MDIDIHCIVYVTTLTGMVSTHSLEVVQPGFNDRLSRVHLVTSRMLSEMKVVFDYYVGDNFGLRSLKFFT